MIDQRWTLGCIWPKLLSFPFFPMYGRSSSQTYGSNNLQEKQNHFISRKKYYKSLWNQKQGICICIPFLNQDIPGFGGAILNILRREQTRVGQNAWSLQIFAPQVFFERYISEMITVWISDHYFKISLYHSEVKVFI